jgi:hypothetical protein
MAGSAKDIQAIYSSYHLEKYQYFEVKQAESYLQAKHKWLIFHSKTTDCSDINPRPKREVAPVADVV